MKNERSHLSAYESLASLNRHFHEILIELETVKSLGLLRRTLVEEVKASVEETRAWAELRDDRCDAPARRNRLGQIQPDSPKSSQWRNQDPNSALGLDPSQTPKFERRFQREKRDNRIRKVGLLSGWCQVRGHPGNWNISESVGSQRYV